MALFIASTPNGNSSWPLCQLFCDDLSNIACRARKSRVVSGGIAAAIDDWFNSLITNGHLERLPIA